MSLAVSGAIFVSIDDNEQARLRLLMDEVFGPANSGADRGEPQRQGTPAGQGFRDVVHEYLLAYARDVRRCVLDASSPETVDPSDFPLEAADGRRYRHLPLRNTNKKFNPVTARTLHFPVYGDPVSGRVSPSPFEGGVEIEPVFGDGRPAVWRWWSAPLIEQRPDDLVCRAIKGRRGERVDVFQKDWLHRDTDGGRRKKLRTIWLAEEVGSTDTAVAELRRSWATSSSRPSLPAWCAGCCRRCRPTPWCSTSSPVRAPPGTPSRCRTSLTAAPAAASA